MDPRHFDDLVKRLAVGTTRRNALKIFGGGIMAGTLGRLRSSSADAAPKKVGICHLTGSATNPVVFITVSTNAIPAHQAHGDVIDPDFQNDPKNCGGCSISCDDGDACTTDTCSGGVCVHTPVNCDDRNACTTDSCDPASGCVYEDVVCDDGDTCTTDSCDPASGCVFEPVVCNVGQACLNGECVGCAGGTCENLPHGCDDDPLCVCFITTEDTGFCHRSEPCDGLTTCTASADCANVPGHPACSTATCCGDIHVCIRPCLGTENFSSFAPEAMTGG